jgi:transcriptional regulator with XRE-family HTH domain
MRKNQHTAGPWSNPPTVKEKTGTSFRRAELREFLRARRRALTPQALGLPPRRRWGFPGLRLQDVAELAGVSTSWYASFELGYALNISARTLSAIATALHLDVPETNYLFHLTGTPQPAQPAPDTIAIVPSLRRLVEEYRDGIALLVDFRYDIVAANAVALRLGLAGSDAGFERNLFWRIFQSPQCRRLSSRWRDVQAAHIVAILRRIYAESDGDARIEALIGELCAGGMEFAQLWEARTVAASSSRRLHFLLPNDDTVIVETVILAAEGGLRVCYFVPIDDLSRERLAGLVMANNQTPA